MGRNRHYLVKLHICIYLYTQKFLSILWEKIQDNIHTVALFAIVKIKITQMSIIEDLVE